MHESHLTRRQFLASATAVPAASALSSASGRATRRHGGAVPAILGGEPVRTKPFHPWPVWQEADESAILPVLRRGVWSRERMVTEAEKKFAGLMGSPYCLTTSNGTNAIITAIRALGIGAGDEVITTPYTAEGIPCSKGLGVIEGKPMNKEGLLEDAFRSKAFQRIYSREKLATYGAENDCPHSDRLCEETVGFHQRVLLGSRADMDDIYTAIRKLYRMGDGPR